MSSISTHLKQLERGTGLAGCTEIKTPGHRGICLQEVPRMYNLVEEIPLTFSFKLARKPARWEIDRLRSGRASNLAERERGCALSAQRSCGNKMMSSS